MAEGGARAAKAVNAGVAATASGALGVNATCCSIDFSWGAWLPSAEPICA